MNNGLFILGLANVAESLGVFWWIWLAERGQGALGLVVLVSALATERVSVFLTIKQLYGENPPQRNIAPTLFGTAVLEMLMWGSWLFLVDAIGGNAGHIIGFLVFIVTNLLVHSVQAAFVLQTPLLYFVSNTKTIVFSIIEAAAGAAFLLLFRGDQVLLGAAVLFIAISIEHLIQASLLEDVPDLIERAKGKRLPVA
ncbi:MAG: hypothetical protein SF029_13155 [bacterium]|nr:hypothetical protein [bacterium]